MSIATGVSGDEKINCHNNFHDIKFSRADRVLPLLTVNSNLKVHDTTVPIDPLLLFQRISVVKRTNEELRIYLEYELAPFPVSLFDEAGMRKTNKSAFYDNFQPLELEPDLNNVTYGAICQAYINYVQKHFSSNSIIVFDGYENTRNSVKAMEQLRRSSKSLSADIYFDEQMVATVSQE